MTKHQSLGKLQKLVEQVAAHCKAHDLQFFICYEVKDNKITIEGRHSEELLVNVAAHLGLNHPAAVHRARMLMMEVAGRQRVESIEKAADGAVVLGIDGKHMKAAEA